MSIKKTWFSYILWLLATGFSVLFTYTYISGIITSYSFEQFKKYYYPIAFSAAFVLASSLLYLLVSLACGRSKEMVIPKWGRRMIHILILCGMTVLFVVTRYKVLFSTSLETVIPMDIYEAAKVIPGNGQSTLYESYYVFEDVYINILSALFLFLGNKMEIMLYFQIFLQAASFLLLLFIGRTLQNGFPGWIPAAVYVLSQFCMETVLCLDADNLWIFITLSVIAVICLLEKVWKNKTITYILINLSGLLFAAFCAIDVFPHVSDWNSILKFWFHEKLLNGAADGYWSFLLLMVLMVFYCISFWKTKTDNVAFYILPVTAFSVILYLDLWPEILAAVFVLIRIYFSFMAAEGLRLLFDTKQKVVTGQETDMAEEMATVSVEQKENDFTWTEMQSIMEQKEVQTSESSFVLENSDSCVDSGCIDNNVSEDTGVIRVSDILKAVSTEDIASEMKAELPSQEQVIDKTALIENVLPMPKKHVTRSFEYAFEPDEELMHYDVEIENDDYDYE